MCFQIAEPNIFKVTQNFKPVVAILKINVVVTGIHRLSARGLSLKQMDNGSIGWALKWLLHLFGGSLCDLSASILTDSRMRVKRILAHVKKGAPLMSIYKVASIWLINQAQLWFLKLPTQMQQAIACYQVSLIFYKRKLNTQVFRRICA